VRYDHTSVLAFIERKWNLPALTYRDANANDLTDFLDLGALRGRAPHVPEAAAFGRSRRHVRPARLFDDWSRDDPAVGKHHRLKGCRTARRPRRPEAAQPARRLG
jgi:hypothetical protein